MNKKRSPQLTFSRRNILKTISFAGLIRLGSTGAAAQVTDRDVWVFDVGDLVVSSPTVVGDTLYVGSNGSDIYAIDKFTGNEKWIFETGDFVNSSPAVVNDTVYIGSNDNSVYAINRNTGEERWEFDTGDQIRSSPTFSNGTVFIGNGDFRDPTDTAIYAINADSGQQEWRYEVGDRVSSAPVVDDEVVYVTSTDGKLYTLDTIDGSLNWSKDIGAGSGSPALVNETVYAAGSGGVFALDKETGSEQWIYEEEVSFISNTPTVANGVLYIGLTSANKVSAISIDSGNEIWDFSTGNKVFSSPTHADGNIFVGNEGGNVFSIDAKTGVKNWQFSVGDETGSSPIVVDGTLYIGSIERDPYGGAVYAIDTDVSGSSNGSRSRLGTLGHNDAWEYADETGLSDSTLMAAVGGAVVGPVFGYGLYRLITHSRDGTGSVEHTSSDTNASSTTTKSETTQSGKDSPTPVEEHRLAAENAIETAVTARSNDNLSVAADAYSEALNEYDAALEELAAGATDQRTEIEQAVESTRADLEAVKTRREQQNEVIDDLQPAERSFQEAIVAYIQDDQTVARIRFRQARDTFEDAHETITDSEEDMLSDPIEVTVQPDRVPPSPAISELPVIPEPAATALADAGIETVDELDHNDQSPWTPAAVGELLANEAIEEDTATALTLVSWWHSDESYTFETAEVIERRQQQASYAFNHTS